MAAVVTLLMLANGLGEKVRAPVCDAADDAARFENEDTGSAGDS